MPKTKSMKLKVSVYHPPLRIDGLPVVNLKKKMKLVISAEDTKAGRSKEPNSCAAAIAAKRQVPHCAEARVHVNRIFLRIGRKWYRGRIPGSLRSEIIAFDRGGKFAPGVYSINPICPSEELALRQRKRQGGVPKLKRGRPGFHRANPVQVKGIRTSAKSEYSHS